MVFSPHPLACQFSVSMSKSPAPEYDSSRPGCIGIVVFRTHRNEPAEAILDLEGIWRCPHLPVLDRVLNALYEPKTKPGSDASFGHIELFRVAVWLKGEARIPRNPRC